MKTTILLLSILAATPFQVAASQAMNSSCSAGNVSAKCQAYIAGLVEGYVASKQNYLPKQPVFDNPYLTRAFTNRVGKSYSTLSNKEPACLPSVLDKSKIIEHLLNSNKPEQLTTQLGNYLRANYGCNPNQTRN